MNRFELLSTHPLTVLVLNCYIVVISWALVVRLIYTPSALAPAALELQVYILRKPLMPMVSLGTLVPNSRDRQGKLWLPKKQKMALKTTLQ